MDRDSIVASSWKCCQYGRLVWESKYFSGYFVSHRYLRHGTLRSFKRCGGIRPDRRCGKEGYDKYRHGARDRGCVVPARWGRRPVAMDCLSTWAACKGRSDVNNASAYCCVTAIDRWRQVRSVARSVRGFHFMFHVMFHFMIHFTFVSRFISLRQWSVVGNQ